MAPSWTGLGGRGRTSANVAWWRDGVHNRPGRPPDGAIPGRYSALAGRSTRRGLLVHAWLRRPAHPLRRPVDLVRAPDPRRRRTGGDHGGDGATAGSASRRAARKTTTHSSDVMGRGRGHPRRRHDRRPAMGPGKPSPEYPGRAGRRASATSIVAGLPSAIPRCRVYVMGPGAVAGFASRPPPKTLRERCGHWPKEAIEAGALGLRVVAV